MELCRKFIIIASDIGGIAFLFGVVNLVYAALDFDLLFKRMAHRNFLSSAWRINSLSENRFRLDKEEVKDSSYYRRFNFFTYF